MIDAFLESVGRSVDISWALLARSSESCLVKLRPPRPLVFAFCHDRKHRGAIGKRVFMRMSEMSLYVIQNHQFYTS